MDDCIFCKIASGALPAKLAAEEEDWLAFHDLDPKAPVHVLVIPRRHVATVNDLRAEDGPLLAKIWTALPGLAARLGIGEEGYRVVVNCLAPAGQSVFHLHFHLLGGRPMGWPPG